MVVSRSSFDLVLERLQALKKLSVDTETTGVRPYHGDRLFSIIIAGRTTPDKIDSYYFNFWPYPGVVPDLVLGKEHLHKLKSLFDDHDKLWFIHKFNFDMPILQNEGIEIKGTVHCTLSIGRVEYNDHLSYDLDACLSRIGLKKLDTVEKWIEENHAWDWVSIPGKAQRKKNKYFTKVPFDVIVPYGLEDARGGYALGESQEKSIETQSLEYPPGVPALRNVMANERRLAHTIYRMERVGVKVDRPYVVRALHYEADRAAKATEAFLRETKRDYSASPKLFAEVFASERAKWEYTEKGNPSFESDVLKYFENPAAKAVLTIRDAKSKLDFYNGFLYHADANDIIHPNFNPGRARSGRFSSSDPNFQNMTSEESTFCRACKTWHEEYADACPDCTSTDIEHPEFLVRRAIVPRPGFILLMPDYDQMEYKQMLDYAKHMMILHFQAKGLSWDESYFEIANRVRGGYDIHKATAELVGITRKQAKTLNFALLYGMGLEKLAKALGLTLDEARIMRQRYFAAMPYVQFMIGTVQDAIKKRGWIRNWAGRKYTFRDRGLAYKGPNYLIQGGCADANKYALNALDEYLLDKKSRLILTIHDEDPLECHESEIATVPREVTRLMESVYPYKYIPLTAGMEWSDKSLADKKKGYPV